MISKRLKTLVKYVDEIDNIMDIGCDHALLDIYLIKNKYTDKIIASDIHENALNAGIENIKRNNLESKIDARLGDGLDVLSDDDTINTLLISGMGTSTILKILDNNKIERIYKLIIQSNNDHDILRKKVTALGFYIDSEEYFQDNNKNYINIVFKKGNRSYTKTELKYGPFLINNKEYLEFELSKIYKIYNLIPKLKLRYRLELRLEIIKLNKYLKKCS